MSRRQASAWLVAALVLPVMAAAPPAGGQQEPVPFQEGSSASGEELARLRERGGDLRSMVVLRYDCESEIGRREVTLFANGTVRLFDGPLGEEEMELGELDPLALDGVLARIAAENLAESPERYHGVEGEWVERCVLELPLREGEGPTTFRFSRYSSLPLELSRVVAVADELIAVAAGDRGAGLPGGYEPKAGDVLRRDDGARFRVVGFTSDGKGLELVGLDVPLTLYLPPDALREQFVELVSRREEW